MTTHIEAKNKIEVLTARLEKSLYKLKYGDMRVTNMDDYYFNKVKSICEKHDYPFPLIREYGIILVDCNTPKLFCTLSSLADDYGIIVDTQKIY